MATRTPRFEVKREVCVHARVVAGLTIRAAATALGCTPTHLGYVEMGTRQASPPLLGKMAEVYGVPVETLFSVSIGTEDAA